MGVLQGASAPRAANDSFAWTKSSIGTTALGDLAGGVGGYQLANYQAAVATRNAALMQQNAFAATQAGNYQAETELEKGGQVVGKEIAGYGASNIDVNVGTPKLVEGSTRTISALDAAMAHYNAAREAYGYKVQAASDTATAGLEKSAGIGSLLSGIAGAGSSIVGGASSLSGRYAQWQLQSQPQSSSALGK